MRARLGSTASEAQLRWWTDELMGKTAQRAAFGASSARIDMELEPELLADHRADADRDHAAESGLQSVEAVERTRGAFPMRA